MGSSFHQSNANPFGWSQSAVSCLVAIRHMWLQTAFQKWISNDKYTLKFWQKGESKVLCCLNCVKCGNRKNMVEHHWPRLWEEKELNQCCVLMLKFNFYIVSRNTLNVLCHSRTPYRRRTLEMKNLLGNQITKNDLSNHLKLKNTLCQLILCVIA